MEAMEIVVFIGFTVLLGGMIILFIADWDFKKDYSGFKDMMMEEDEVGFEKVDKAGFAGAAYKVYDECVSTGFDDVQSMYIYENGTLTKSGLFAIYKELNWCRTIQSAENNCGEREDVVMGEITLPRVVSINCTGGKLYIR